MKISNVQFLEKVLRNSGKKIEDKFRGAVTVSVDEDGAAVGIAFASNSIPNYTIKLEPDGFASVRASSFAATRSADDVQQQFEVNDIVRSMVVAMEMAVEYN